MFLSIVGKSILRSIPTMLGVIFLGFFLLKLMPGDAVDAIVGMAGSATEETTKILRETYGLDQNILAQLWYYLLGVVTFNFGYSISYSSPVIEVIGDRLPSTLVLMFTAFSLALIFGIIIGWIMAVFAGRWPDRALTSVTLLLYSAPNFWVGLMAIVLFSAKLQWLPSGGAESIGSAYSGWAWFQDRVAHLILPACALAAFFVAIYARLTRAAMLEVLRQDYIRTAAAKGLHPVVVQFRHGLRNALIPVTTVAGMHLGNLLGGAVVVETVFNWPGLGGLTVNALAARDTQVLLGILMLSSISVILANILIDWLVAILDPRIRRQK